LDRFRPLDRERGGPPIKRNGRAVGDSRRPL